MPTEKALTYVLRDCQSGYFLQVEWISLTRADKLIELFELLADSMLMNIPIKTILNERLKMEFSKHIRSFQGHSDYVQNYKLQL